jgi:hypothetical protein
MQADETGSNVLADEIDDWRENHGEFLSERGVKVLKQAADALRATRNSPPDPLNYFWKTHQDLELFLGRLTATNQSNQNLQAMVSCALLLDSAIMLLRESLNGRTS